MHCDRVFAILTRGPFPSGEVTDVAVELHLAHCVSCRRLAEALRPSDAVPRETIEQEDALALPGYRGDHPDLSADWTRSRERVGAAADVAVNIPARRERRGRLAHSQFTRLLAMTLVGVAIGAAWTTLARPQGEVIGSRNFTTAAVVGIAARAAVHPYAELLAGLDLPQACRNLGDERFLPLSADPRVPLYLAGAAPAFKSECCTGCHSAGDKNHLSKTARSRLIQSCTICHADDSGPR